jgi:hypothetical protein
MKPLVVKRKITFRTYDEFCLPLRSILSSVPELKSRGDRPLKMTFENQLDALIWFHLQEHDSARHLIFDLNANKFAKEFIAPDGSISRSSFSEAINNRGLEQLQHVFRELSKQARALLPADFQHFGDIVAIDGTLIDSVLSMYWADYRTKSKKAKGHFGFDINRGFPTEFRLTEGKAGERPFVDQILSVGQTGVMDRGYQSHILFDSLQKTGKNFVCRIKACTIKDIIKENCVKPSSYVFQDSSAYLGTAKNRSELPVRVVGYQVAGVKYYVATNRFDLTAEQIAEIYKLRWNIETFFSWWKRHLHVYHLIARSRYGLTVQMLGGLITYLLMVIYCRKNFNENVSVQNIRRICSKIQNESMTAGRNTGGT